MGLFYLRVFMLLMLLLIWFSGWYIIYIYWIILLLATEVLNMLKNYKTGNPASWNVFYAAFLLFITLERGRGRFAQYFGLPAEKFKLTPNAEEAINIFEHAWFAVLVCSMLYFMFSAFKQFGFWGNFKRILIIALAFNFIGFLQEVFQNSISPSGLLQFNADSYKDMVVNFCGSILFLLLMWVKERHDKNGFRF